jgi:hypothetical protein
LGVLGAGLIGKRHIDGILAEPGAALMAKRPPPAGRAHSVIVPRKQSESKM